MGQTENLKHMLVVDDVELNRKLLNMMFEEDFVIYEAADGVETLEILADPQKDIAIVILDLLMPKMDGFEVLARKNKDPRIAGIPVVVATAADDLNDSIRALELGAVDVLTKPFNLDVRFIRQRIRNIISRQEADKLEEQNRIYADLARRAAIDELSGLYNRSGYYHAVRDLLKANPEKKYLIVRWDIDRFKIFNDLFGIMAGDKLLKDIGRKIQQTLDPSIPAGRLQADHFCCCVEKNQLDIPKFYQAMVDFLRTYPVHFEYVLAFGIYEITDTSIDVELMCDRALLALKTTKAHFSRRIAYYDDSLRQKLKNEQDIISEMYPALQAGQFDIYLQPQINHIKGEIVGAEALVRWFHPRKGMISPGKFIPIFERNGFITTMDRYIWERACQVLRGWLDTGRKAIPISVNISRIDIYDSGLCGFFSDLIRKYQLPPEMLRLEITESAYIEDQSQLSEVVNQLQKMGFTIEMDDFGSGYSSLNTLSNLPVDILKLDMAFFSSDEIQVGRGGIILNSIVRMARWLDLLVVAEGVERSTQAEFLKTIGCDVVQGYFYAKPMPVSDFEALTDRSETGNMIEENRLISRVDTTVFWNPESVTALLFNSFVGAAAVFVFDGKQLETLRVNDKYFDVIGITRDDYKRYQSDLFPWIVPEDQQAFLSMFEKAAESGQDTECEARGSRKSARGGEIWFRARTRQISANGTRRMFYVLMEDITEKKQLQRTEKENYEKMGSLISSIPGGVALYEWRNGFAICTFFNDGLLKMLGISRIAYQKICDGESANPIFPEDRPGLHTAMEQGIASGDSFDYEFRIRKGDGATIWLHICSSIYTPEDGIPRFYAVFTDITRQKEIEKQNRWQDERFRIITDGYDLITFDYDPFGDELTWGIGSELEKHINHYLAGNANLTKIVYAEDLPGYLDKLREAASTIISGYYEFRLNSSGLKYGWCRAHYVSIADEDGKVFRVVGRIEDISHEKDLTPPVTRLRRRASDLSFDIPDHGEIERMIRQRLDLLGKEDNSALMIFNLDDFKLVNDKLGRLFGDAFLKEVALRIAGILRSSDIFGRYSGDEFIIYMDQIYSTAAIEKKAGDIIHAITAIPVSELDEVHCSIGVAYADADNRDFATLFQQADTALYKAKELGKACFQIFDPVNMRIGFSAPGVRIHRRVDFETSKQNLELFNSCFSLLYHCEDISEVIPEILERIGLQFDVSRVYICESTADGLRWNNTYEWCNKDIPAQIGNLQNVTLEQSADEIYEMFDKDGIFYCGDVSKLKGPLAQLLNKQEIKALLQCLILDETKPVGFIGFDECQKNRAWTQEQTNTLMRISEILSVFLVRERNNSL